MAVIEVCDVCHSKRPDKRFKVKMSKRGQLVRTGYGSKWDTSLWQPYERIGICEDCAEKLLGVKSQKTFMNEIIENIQKQTKKNKKEKL